MNIKVKNIESFPENSNPYHYDLYRMGTQIGKDLLMMHSNHPSEEMKYMILVNTKTGKRSRIDIED